MEEFVSNSNRSKEEQKKPTVPEKKVEKVISGTAKLRKKNVVQKFADVFISEDIDNVKSYILMDVLVPAFKKAISDIVVNGIDMILYGEAGHSKKGSLASKVSYQNFYGRDPGRKDYNSPSRGAGARFGYDHSDVVLESRSEAQEVLSKMDELISAYGVASVGDLYEFAGLPTDYTDNKYGWTDIRSANVMHVRDGYLIKMPKAMPLN